MELPSNSRQCYGFPDLEDNLAYKGHCYGGLGGKKFLVYSFLGSCRLIHAITL
uniref:Uncharacterized protein n=1 Tax=Solanum tuberosum TaxID=4113 RepID=M1C1Z1_SOLTU